MESSKPSSSTTPYPGGAGAGGKFRKPPRKRPSTPYDRPPPSTANNQSQSGGWLSKLVVNPARRLIVGGATRILPSFLFNPESSSADEYVDDSSSDHDDEDVDAIVHALDDAKHTLEVGVSSSIRNAGPSNEVDKLKGISDHVNIQQDNSKKSTDDLGLDQIETLLKGKQFSRDESRRLMEILNSRLVDDSNAEGAEKAANVTPQGKGKGNVSDRELPSTSNIRKQYDVETPMPRLQSAIQDEVAASPIDIAKAYMGSRASESGFKTYGNNTSTAGREQQINDVFPSKPHFFTPSSKSSTCWPGAMVQDHRGYLTPQSQRSRYGLHNIPRTPYSRTKPRLNQLQGDGKSSNVSLTTFQQSRWQIKTSSDVMDGGYGSVGPIRRVRNKFASEPQSEGPTRRSPAQLVSSSSASRSFMPVFQKNPVTSGTSHLNTPDKHEQTFKAEAGPSNETVRKILEHLDRHKPTPKEKAAELKLATEWKRSPSRDTTLKGPESGISFRDQMKTSNAETKTSTTANDAAAGPSFGLKNTDVANEKSRVPDSKEKEKSQPWSFDNKTNGQDLTKKRPSQPNLKPISFKRPDPQQVVSSDNGRGFTFSFPATASSASEPQPPTPSILPFFSPPAAPQSKDLPVTPAYSFGLNKSSERVVFSFPSTSSAAVDDGVSDLKFDFGSEKKRVSFGLIGSDAIVIN
ncbi:hypothetical protein HanRHA438_Chr06g0273891 [Helianthus annuus]|uniref:Putative nucleoporin-related protein n=1 Tax=Helianthus annuus TaxID=4232 RepID=A0A251UJM6_HELAN|nr:nuclear pore complex protein NUP1 [Helianthus annuus]KAF5802866.1 hypothetical protein HanXRQr2_Chr06g0264581 [Helianthus annuus]KAJ0573975.1 hypothetical protein HanHA89_Chr06g0232871 [Helianthus annuus]KAJ0741198.1 hypothetical protein HanOQP8_Chr06g0225321 [Helianthus annuus]KAJ0912403.1 hypothetical protein HanRHA438_Chr06g0273891 [Helianthus annuus]